MSGSPANAAPDGPDDHELLAAHCAGDPDAFALLVHRHRDRLWAVALRTLGQPEEAADALQDALLSAFRAAPSFRGDSAVTTWLHRIVVNACLDRIRRSVARPSVPLGDRDLPAPTDPQGQIDTRLAVRAALAQLPVEQREALVLVDIEDLPVAEAARLLDVPVGTVKSRCSRGRTALAAMLRDIPEEDDHEADAPRDRSRTGQPGNRNDPSHVASSGGHDDRQPVDTDNDWWR